MARPGGKFNGSIRAIMDDNPPIDIDSSGNTEGVLPTEEVSELGTTEAYTKNLSKIRTTIPGSNLNIPQKP